MNSNKINTNSFFANLSVKATSPERRGSIDHAWRAFNNGNCNSPETVKEILEMEFTNLSRENGRTQEYIDMNIPHFADILNATKLFKIFNMISNSFEQ